MADVSISTLGIPGGHAPGASVHSPIGPPGSTLPPLPVPVPVLVPLPVDPESFRETAQHYAIFDRTIGENPFNFFESKIGVPRGTSLHA